MSATITVIRRAVLDDAPELARLITPLGYPTTAEDVLARWEPWTAEGGYALVAPSGDRLMGVVTLSRRWVLHRPKPLGRVTSLAVDEEARGRGLGRALMRAAEEALAADGCGLVEVTSAFRRTHAHEFYRHVGYTRTSYRFMREIDR